MVDNIKWLEAHEGVGFRVKKTSAPQVSLAINIINKRNASRMYLTTNIHYQITGLHCPG